MFLLDYLDTLVFVDCEAVGRCTAEQFEEWLLRPEGR